MKIQDCFTQVNLFVPISELYVVVVTAFNCLPLRWEETPCYVITVCKFSFCSLPLPQKTVSTGIWKTAPFPRKPNYSVYLALNIQGGYTGCSPEDHDRWWQCLAGLWSSLEPGAAQIHTEVKFAPSKTPVFRLNIYNPVVIKHLFWN